MTYGPNQQWYLPGALHLATRTLNRGLERRETTALLEDLLRGTQ